jgi:hypothetical protein
MAGCLLIGYVEIQNLRFPDVVINAPIPAAGKMIQTLGREQAGVLFRHFAAEENRRYSSRWEQVQLALGLALGICLLRATQTRILPIAFCAMMIALVVFEHVALTPELAYQGRETDFPPNNTALGPMTHVWALQQVYIGVEVVKLIAGTALAGYLFVFRTRRGRKETGAMDHTLQGIPDR